MRNIRQCYTDRDVESILSISEKRDWNSINLSYRRLKRISGKEISEWNYYQGSTDFEINPRIRQIALFLKKKYKIKFNHILFIKAKDFLSQYDKLSVKFSGVLPKDRYIKKELISQGFVPLSSYKTHKRYAYIITNRKIEDDFYIYPRKFSDNYEILKKGKYPNIHNHFMYYGIPGIIKIKYSES